MKIYLIRHGETEYNRQHLFYGVSDVALNQRGIEQSLLLKEKLQQLTVETPIYTSELLRTKQTADLIFPQNQHFPLAAFNEKDFGLWEGKNADEIEALYPVEWKNWLAEPFTYTSSQAESFQAFQKRVLVGWQQVLKAEKTCVLVIHMGVIRVIIKHCFPKLNFWDIQLEQGDYGCLEWRDGVVEMVKWENKK
ncbi:alpha-ribazole phosphatase [Enterococcus sp. PF1-24]|uniref:histidine phosphatase family protein n=1 Tax=unclassified Enterococcus TaxID=2608891 RepID=UPI0024741447|nr:MULTISPECIES: histidine phosphatase family protein [unclassified Enterococcus]MDH6363365.1 alpha-ribazole phosphatase [Enterococcus sp. PFB1-1]MDH6400334.1 alpha-ribazole phosphatase [Enterococcus sp. PF1-24]